MLGERPDGFVYLGLGLSAAVVADALVAQGFAGPRIMNTAGLRGYHGDFAARCDGWLYVDMHSDANRTLAALCDEMKIERARWLWAGKGHDLGRLVAEGLARAPDFSREGLKLGLEKVKWLPAAEGYEGTLLGFGIQDRGALHGRYLVVRQWRGGETVEVGERLIRSCWQSLRFILRRHAELVSASIRPRAPSRASRDRRCRCTPMRAPEHEAGWILKTSSG